MVSAFCVTASNCSFVINPLSSKTSTPATVSFNEPSEISKYLFSSLSVFFPLPSAIFRITEEHDLIICPPKSYRISLGSLLTMLNTNRNNSFASLYTCHSRNLKGFIVSAVRYKLLFGFSGYLLSVSFIVTRYKSPVISWYFWRRGRDSNPRSFRSTVFKTAALNRSATSPELLTYNSQRVTYNKKSKTPSSLLVTSYKLRVILSAPPRYFLSASGMMTVPSGCWKFSRIATTVRPTARPEPFNV